MKSTSVPPDSPAAEATVDATLLDSEVVDENNLKRLLRRAGRTLATPALEALELLLDASTPAPARLTMLAALSYLLMPVDLIPDFLPVAGFSDDLVALTAMVGIWNNHITPEIRSRARRKLDQWFPLGR
ncbi:MAG: hypothetical protein CL862_13420 [Cyanobium sp. NAT70]|nr:hypothetical protein [Cyanobium sp. NAT70]|tara:strand:+ start:2425 stop:2811 length:387 start_codon:yes stop_codon:yes gene_type:complete